MMDIDRKPFHYKDFLIKPGKTRVRHKSSGTVGVVEKFLGWPSWDPQIRIKIDGVFFRERPLSEWEILEHSPEKLTP